MLNSSLLDANSSMLKMKKKELRSLYRQQRQALSLAQIDQQSQQLAEHFFQVYPLEDVRAIHIFLPILAKKEINTFYLINALRQQKPQISLITSRTEAKTHQMPTFRLEADTKLEPNSWGVPEPVEAAPFPELEIDMVLLPLLCFDQRGYRVGYGGGFYDRFLLKCRPNVHKVGLSLFPPIDQIEDIENTDIPLDEVITPTDFYDFKPSL